MLGVASFCLGLAHQHSRPCKRVFLKVTPIQKRKIYLNHHRNKTKERGEPDLLRFYRRVTDLRPATKRTVQPLYPLVVIGTGGHAVSVANVARSAGFSIKHFIDRKRRTDKLLGIDLISDISELANIHQYCFCIAVGDNAVRERLFAELSAKYSNLIFPSLIHSSAVISDYAEIGEGTVVMPRAVVGPNSHIGRFCILNTQSSIDHDSSMSDYASLAPGVVTGGTVNIGIRSAISIGAVIKHGTNVGDDCVVGANSYLNKDLSPCCVAYGTPAKVVRERSVGDPYFQ